LPVKPVTEGSDGSVVSIPAVIAAEISQKGIDVAWGQVIVVDEGLKTSLVEFSSPW
jgi:hypothetical protein